MIALFSMAETIGLHKQFILVKTQQTERTFSPVAVAPSDVVRKAVLPGAKARTDGTVNKRVAVASFMVVVMAFIIDVCKSEVVHPDCILLSR
jgi:hypothetical protein